MTTRVSMHELGRYADVMGVLHRVDRANAARRRRDAAELWAFLFSIGVLAAAMGFVGV